MANLNILCAGGFRAAMEHIAPAFEKADGIGLNVTFATPAKTREYLEAGFAFDLGVVVGAVVQAAGEQGFAIPQKTFKLALSPIGMGVPEGGPVLSVGTLPQLRAALEELESIALSDPKAGTNLANEVLACADSAGLDLRAKVIFIQGPGSVVSGEVAKGVAQAVITLASEISPIEGIRYIGKLPPELQTEYAMQVLAHDSAGEAAQALLDFLTGDVAREIMLSVGLEPV